MPAFRVSGSTGQAPTAVWFGAVPDKYNLLMACYSNFNGTTNVLNFVSTLSSCNLIKQWVPWDSSWAGGGASHVTASIGATASAPDGTSNANHVIEGTNTGYHVMVSGLSDGGQLSLPMRRRLAVFAKADTRTRCWLAISAFLGIPGAFRSESGIRCVFDLAGGRVGVAPTFFGTGGFNFTSIGSGIIPYGNGWYLCYIDVSTGNNGNPIQGRGNGLLQAAFGVDAGSGTGAANVSYAGDGTSGVLAWRTNMMHPRTYGINNQVFFDDFNSLSTIDINNTGAPGFNWYCGGSVWPTTIALGGFGWTTPIPPGLLTISGSVLTVPTVHLFHGANLTTATYAGGGPNTFVGNVWHGSLVYEFRGKYDTDTQNTDELAWWSLPIEYLTDTNFVNTGTQQEIDLFDSGAPGSQVTPTTAILDNHGVTGVEQDFVLGPYQGLIVWQPNFSYAINNVLFWQGAFYISLVGSNVGNQPDISPTKWSVTGPPPPATNEPTIANSSTFDPSNQLNLYTMIRVVDNSKYGSVDDTGHFCMFFNGISTQNVDFGGNLQLLDYGSSISQFNQGTAAPSILQRGDGWRFIGIIGAGFNRSIYSDYVRIMQ